MPSELIKRIASDSVIDTAYEWLCKRRKDYSHNDEVWDIRFRWAEFKPHLQKRLLSGEHTISSQIVIMTPERRTELWSAKDALVLKAMAIVLGDHLKPVLSRNCYHLAGNGGAKAAVRATARRLKQGQHVWSFFCWLGSLLVQRYLRAVFSSIPALLAAKYCVFSVFFSFISILTCLSVTISVSS